MLREDLHVSDQDLLLWADGEVTSQRAAEIQRHVSACWTCRARRAELERAIADFVQLYRRELEAKLPPMDGPRALLKARLAERMASSGAGGSNWFSGARLRTAAALAALLLVAGLAIRISQHGYPRIYSGAVPNVTLTPGAIDPIGVQDVCSAQFPTNDPAVPDPLRREVLREYGLTEVSANAYEIDYLVTPQLGGATNIRNLWPQPALNTVWNARVKDALEDRLHNMVCSGQLDLATAQRELSQDWVAAYKKYFKM
jgi:hypothetical protein